MTTIVLIAFAICGLVAIAWCWRRRVEAERRAERAERAAEAAREMAEIGSAAKELAHDIGNILTAIHFSLAALHPDEPDLSRETLRDAESFSLNLYGMLESWQGLPDPPPSRPSAELLDMLIRLFAGIGVEIDLSLESSLPFRGSDDDAVRVLARVLFAASRDAIRAREPRLAITMNGEALRVRYRAPRASRGEILAGAAAARAGWVITSEDAGDDVEILIRPS